MNVISVGDLDKLVLAKGHIMNSVVSRVEIVVLNWNGKEDTLACLHSLQLVDYPNFGLIVVDNGSSDDSVSAIRAGFPGIDLIETGANLGYAGGNNVGIRHALENGADFVLLLNNDTVVDPQLLTRFVEAANAKPRGGAYAAKMFYYAEPRKIWYAGGRWRPDSLSFVHDGQDEEDRPGSYDALVETDYACGCAMFLRVEALKDVGLLDERFFLTYEETDWCYRAREKGYSSIFVPQAKLWHKVSASFGGQESPLVAYFMLRNLLYWAKRHIPRRELWRLYRRIASDLLNTLFPPLEYLTGSLSMSARVSFWAVANYLRGVQVRYRRPITQAHLAAVRDYLLGRDGDSPKAVRALRKG